MDKEILKKQIKIGFSTRQLAESSGKSQTSVRYWLDKYKLETLRSSPYRKPRLCKECGEANPDNFYPNPRKKCKKCHNKETAKIGRNRRIEAIKLLGGACQECGYDKCYSALEFHHLDPSTKDVNYSGMRGWSFEKIKKEIKNCILLCANCHREEHERLRQK